MDVVWLIGTHDRLKELLIRVYTLDDDVHHVDACADTDADAATIADIVDGPCPRKIASTSISRTVDDADDDDDDGCNTDSRLWLLTMD